MEEEGYAADAGSILTDGEYQCACCGNVYSKGWSDEEAAAEKDALFPEFDDEDMAIVCDDCFKAMGFK